jgi:hypothetical protein
MAIHLQGSFGFSLFRLHEKGQNCPADILRRWRHDLNLIALVKL